MKEKISVLIADDNQEFSHTLTNYINSQEDMEVVDAAKDGNEAIDMINNSNKIFWRNFIRNGRISKSIFK